MGFLLNVSSPLANSIDLGKESITNVKITTDIPVDSDARSTYLGTTLTIKGKIISEVDGDNDVDQVTAIGKWALVPAEKADSYRSVTVKVITASLTVREYVLPNAFVVDYFENYGDTDGTGTFTLILKQKKNKIQSVSITGGFDAAV